jgi:hypothetical protein
VDLCLYTIITNDNDDELDIELCYESCDANGVHELPMEKDEAYTSEEDAQDEEPMTPRDINKSNNEHIERVNTKMLPRKQAEISNIGRKHISIKPSTITCHLELYGCNNIMEARRIECNNKNITCNP